MINVHSNLMTEKDEEYTKLEGRYLNTAPYKHSVMKRIRDVKIISF